MKIAEKLRNHFAVTGDFRETLDIFAPFAQDTLTFKENDFVWGMLVFEDGSIHISEVNSSDNLYFYTFESLDDLILAAKATDAVGSKDPRITAGDWALSQIVKRSFIKAVESIREEGKDVLLQ